MYSIEFIFRQTHYDTEFYTLDGLILEAAEAMNGYIGKTSWQSPDGTTRNSIYYWQDKTTLQAFAAHPKHIEAKRHYKKWYEGYHVVISKIQRTYGDGVIEHPTTPKPPENH